jgi:HPt (histidine-containing phosphotransfer) domain-containing protein
MQGDRERCLAAGMDGYLAKPIDVEELIAAVERYPDATLAAPRVAPADLSAEQLPVFDEHAALAYAGDDRRLLIEVVSFFRADYPAALRRIERALERGDAEALRLAAHALKGSLATVGSPAGRDRALTLEQMGRSGNLTDAAASHAALRQAIAALDQALLRAGLVPRPRRPGTPQRKLKPKPKPKARAKPKSKTRTAFTKRSVHGKDSRRRR